MAAPTGSTIGGKSPFAALLSKDQRDFSGGLNTKVSPFLLADNELSDIQNMNFDQKGTLQKRKGFVKHYAVQFSPGPVRGSVNYRKEDGTSRLVVGADDKLFSDNPQFLKLWDLETDWEEVGSTRLNCDTISVAGDLRLQLLFGLGSSTAILGGSIVGGPNTSAVTTATWLSNPVNITSVVNKLTGIITDASTVPPSTTRLIETRTAAAADMIGASAWVGLGALGAVVSPANNFVQIRVTMTTTTGAIPSVQSLQITFDTTPAMVQIAAGLDTRARYTFAIQNDLLWIVNGVNTNQKWDGITAGTVLAGGSPPVGRFVIVHKNRMFTAGTSTTNRSRLYFSDLQLPESWPALNFVDVGKGDGDSITGLAIHNDNLIVFKDGSTWALQGDAPANFALRRVTNDAGTINMQSVAYMKNTLGCIARDGIRFFDGVRNAIASEKIGPNFDALNQRQLALAAGIFFNNKYYLSVPEGAANNNTTLLIFDTLRTAWTIYRGIPAAEFVIWRRYNQDILMFGSSLIGQMYDMETGFNDDGAPIDCWAVTRAFDLGGPGRVKLVRNSFTTVSEPLGRVANAIISFISDLGAESATITKPTVLNRALNVIRAIPSIVGVATVRTIAVKVRNNEIDRGFNLYDTEILYVDKGLRETT